MEIYTIQEVQNRWDEMLDRVEAGEHIGILGEDGTATVMVPADDPIVKMYSEHNEAS
jgi:antitoxin (DNA-binding transcriptional repressor) of toxin-antitoxin stability system